ncbi:MAG: flagellar hook-associated protein FlgL [Butyrivibrio sp.]
MRITNTMMMNSTLKNVGKSKNNLADLENQMATEKKITRPSDDPIVAIRALSLRSSLAEINQYLKSNIPDARSWLKVAESSLDNMDSILSDIYKYCDQGASDQFTSEDRSAIIQTLQQYKNALYSELNADYAGRYCFTGYKTDTSFTFLTDESARKSYEIEEQLTGSDLDKSMIIKRPVDDSTVTQIDAADMPDGINVHRLRLAYDWCSKDNYSDVTVDGTTYNITKAVTHEEMEMIAADPDYKTKTNEIYFVYDTGELVISDDLYSTFRNAKDIEFTYQKENFAKGDVRPEMYFNCKDITDAGNPVEYNQTAGGQAINFAINFNQSLRVNTLGKDTVSYKIGRDIDDMCNALQKVTDVEAKIKKLNDMYNSEVYSDSQKEDISTMLEACERELDYAMEYMESIFSKELTRVSGYQQTVDLQLADLGARSKRLTLTESRLTEQNTTFSDLKSKNEDAELEDTVVKLSAASTLYEAALTAASDCVKQSLLNFI